MWAPGVLNPFSHCPPAPAHLIRLMWSSGVWECVVFKSGEKRVFDIELYGFSLLNLGGFHGNW